MKTVINFNKPSINQPIFCGEDLGMQTYSEYKYPQLHKLFEDMLDTRWKPTEISLLKDRADFKKLTPEQQYIFTKNLCSQTMMDTIIARGADSFAKYCTNNELEQLLGAWQIHELIHSWSYSHIIKNVYADPIPVFESISTDKSVVIRATKMKNLFDKMLSNNTDVKDVIYKTLVASNVLEGVRFYASFAVSFAFAHQKLMTGNASIISLIRREESLHVASTTEILRILHKNENENFKSTVDKNREWVVEFFKDSVCEEHEWSDILFQNGSIIGLNAELLNSYIEYLADLRLKNIGFPPIYNTKNPLGWLSTWMDPDKQNVAPQEQEIINYSVNNSVDDVEGADFDFISLG